MSAVGNRGAGGEVAYVANHDKVFGGARGARLARNIHAFGDPYLWRIADEAARATGSRREVIRVVNNARDRAHRERTESGH